MVDDDQNREEKFQPLEIPARSFSTSSSQESSEKKETPKRTGKFGKVLGAVDFMKRTFDPGTDEPVKMKGFEAHFHRPSPQIVPRIFTGAPSGKWMRQVAVEICKDVSEFLRTTNDDKIKKLLTRGAKGGQMSRSAINCTPTGRLKYYKVDEPGWVQLSGSFDIRSRQLAIDVGMFSAVVPRSNRDVEQALKDRTYPLQIVLKLPAKVKVEKINRIGDRETVEEPGFVDTEYWVNG